MINHHISERPQRELLITKAVQFLTGKSLWEVEAFLSKVASCCRSKSCEAEDTLYSEDSFAGLQCDHMLDLIPSGETFPDKCPNLASSPKPSSVNTLQKRWKWHDPTMWSAACFCICGEKAALKYPMIPNTEPLPVLRFPYLLLEQKKISQASNLFCYR